MHIMVQYKIKKETRKYVVKFRINLNKKLYIYRN